MVYETRRRKTGVLYDEISSISLLSHHQRANEFPSVRLPCSPFFSYVPYSFYTDRRTAPLTRLVCPRSLSHCRPSTRLYKGERQRPQFPDIQRRWELPFPCSPSLKTRKRRRETEREREQPTPRESSHSPFWRVLLALLTGILNIDIYPDSEPSVVTLVFKKKKKKKKISSYINSQGLTREEK